jgi:hypothetical protein
MFILEKIEVLEKIKILKKPFDLKKCSSFENIRF